MPHTKRQKMRGEDSGRVHDRIFASRTASFRRADSLKSVEGHGVDDGKACTLHLFLLSVAVVMIIIII
jgi:hypothetical protein